MRGALLGPSFSDEEALAEISPYSPVYQQLRDEDLFPTVARALTEQKIVGWFQDRMEFGPRALGNRSILADPRSEAMQRVLNLKVKYREGFRPFAPSVLCEDMGEYFELHGDSPYMLLVAPLREGYRRTLSEHEESMEGFEKLRAVRSDIPAVTHVDCSARIQTVHPETNPRFHRLLQEFKALTGLGVLVNTSFNVRDEPIVCTPGDAYRCFMGTEMDMLVLGRLVLRKEEQ
jgi:carbamoyltransferase